MDKVANDIYNKTSHVLQDQKEYLAYVRAEQTELDKKAMIKYAKKEGITEGKEEGKIETAAKLKDMGLSIEDISKATDLSLKCIEKL